MRPGDDSLVVWLGPDVPATTCLGCIDAAWVWIWVCAGVGAGLVVSAEGDKGGDGDEDEAGGPAAAVGGFLERPVR